MERKVYEQMAKLDSQHWWFTARRRILDGLIERIVRPPNNARVLELGAGTGHNLAMLSRFGQVEASELDPIARELASERLGRPVVEAALPDLSMFPQGAYDLVALLDVLEHVPDDKNSLRAIYQLLKPGGALLLTVPINPWMFSAHDVVHHHHRRYRKGEIRRLAEEAGYSIELLSPFNSLLFPPIAAVRFMGKLTGKDDSDDAMPSPFVNKLLDGVFGLERGIIGRVPMPFGVSLVAVLRRSR
ncbi:class I SAM-dependent methyltransferase [Sphingomonas sp. NSE70-1]|uniref:Class I SAM-dependent methyltransferase n=1 Tax=Sphingomonas caseinilyticus TaxID=2908205 RepID=A0ABT0RVT8_9SPHN|nr:class I SAM-dependent methyltransferase [Sphingomonas caseinilyticus]MCL6698926.1 class I SAM-dependent methyltransferase [Sphingomonas caseinilyticus]